MAGLLLFSSSAMASDGRGVLHTQTNDPNGNTVQRCDRGPGGSLTSAGTFATGGSGLADPIGTTLLVPSPRDLHFDANGRYLHAVSPGGQATVYHVGDDGSLMLSDTAPPAAGITGAATL